MTNEVKAILTKYNLLNDNIYEDNLDFMSDEELSRITDINVIIECASTKQKIQLLKCANELNALDNDTLYLTYTLETEDYQFTYLTTLNVVNTV